MQLMKERPESGDYIASLRLDRKSHVPLHAQIESLLRDLISHPRYAEGALLPDEVSLARQLGVSRSTIRAGMSKLIFEGLVERRQGHGSRVTQRPLQTGLSEWQSLSGEMGRQGIEVQNYSVAIDFVEAPDEVQSALQLKSSRSLWRLSRLRGWLGEKVVLTVSWMHPRLGIQGTEEFGKRPLYEIIGDVSRIVPVRSVENITACLADTQLAEELDVAQNSPLLLRKRTSLDANNDPIEYNLNWYRTDIHSLRMDLRRNPQ